MMVMSRTEMFDVIADHSAIFEADLVTGEFTWVSKPLGVMFGYPVAGELEGEVVEVLIPPEKREVHRSYREEYAKSPDVRLMGARRRLEGVRKNGSRFPIEISLLPKRSGKRWVVFGQVFDMTGHQPPPPDMTLSGKMRIPVPPPSA